MQQTLNQLQRQIDALTPAGQRQGHVGQPIMLGIEPVDAVLDGALARGALHEVFAASHADSAALTGFAAGLALRAAQDMQGQSKILWLRQAITQGESGSLYAHGLAALGFDPERLIAIEANRPDDVLRAGLDAVRCAPLGAVLIEIWGNPKSLDLTATRRLALAAETSGVTPLLLRIAAEPSPSVAMTRWQIAAAPSLPLAANAPGRPAFDVSLLRNRTGASGQRWHLEWNHEQKRFCTAAAVSGSLAAIPDKRPVSPAARYPGYAGKDATVLYRQAEQRAAGGAR